MSSTAESDPKQQRARVLFEYGNDAATKGNFDYAIDMYRQACKLVPGQLTYRQALRSVQRRKFGNDPKQVGRMVGARTQPIRMRARASRSKGQHEQALETLEEAFLHSPWDVGASMEAAESAEALGFLDVARWLMESVAPQSGDDLDFYRHQAHVYEINKDWQKAIFCWEKVKKISPYDENAIRQINALAANATIARAGLNEALSKSPSGGSGPETALSQEVEDLKRTAVTPEQRWLKEIDEHPDAIGAYLSLVDHYRHQGRLDDCERILARALRALPTEALIQQEYAEVQISRIKKAIDALTPKVQANPADAARKAKLEELTTMLAQYEIKEFRRRLTLKADDSRTRFELGLRLAKAGQHDEAIREFQQARSDPELKVQALYQAGLSFEANGVPKLAERSYQEAIKGADPDDAPTLNAIHYRLGRIAEAQGNLAVAEDHYNEVAANDYSFLDVAQRLKTLNRNRDS